MAGKTYNSTIKFTGQFDSSGITKGLQEIKKQMSNTHIGEDLRKQLETALSKVEANIPALEKMSAKGEYNTKDLEAFQKIVLQVSKDMQALDKLAAEADFTKTFSAADTEKIKQFEKQLTEVENKLKNTRKEIVDNFSKSDQGKIGGRSNATLNGFIEQLISVPPDQIESKLDEIIKETEQQANNAIEKLQQDFQTKVGHKTGREGFIELIFGKDSGVSLKDNKTLGLSKVTGDQGAYSVYNKIRDDILALKQDASAEDINKILERYQAFVEEYFDVPEGKQSILANIITPEIVENLKQFTGEEGIAKLKALLGEEKLKLLADGEAEKLKLTQEQAAFLKQRLDELVQSKKLTADQAKNVEEALGGMNNKIQEGSEQIRKEKAQADALSATFGSLANRITNSISALTVFNKSIQIIHKAIDSVKELDAAFTQIAIVSERSNEQAWQMFDSFNKLAKQYSITTKDLTEGAKLFYQQGLNAADTMKMVEASTISAALGEVTMTEAANTLTAAIQGYNESAAVAMDYTDKIAMVGAVSAADFNELSAAMEKTASSAYTAGIDFDHLLGFLGRMIEVTREAPANLGTAMKTIIARFEDMKKDPNALIDGASANKVESALATIGIALRDTAGEFRPLQDVFVELGKKWDSLTRNQQAYIATVAAGSRQQSRFLAMMNDFDRTLELIEESQNSSGAAAKQYAIYQDSAAAATARLTAAWEEFYTKIVNSEQIIWVLDRLKDLVEVMTKVGPIVSAIGASLAALGGQAIIKGLSGGLTKTFTTVATTGKMATLSLSGLGKGVLALGASLGKLILIVAAVTAVLWLGVKAWKAWDKYTNPDKYKVKELTKDIKDLNESISKNSENVKSLEDLMKRYDELAYKVYRSKEEQEELNNIINQINENSERAIVSIKANGDAHLDNANSVKKEIEAKKELVKFEANQKYEKQQEIFGLQREGKTITAEQAREADLGDLADYLEFQEDENVKQYKQIKKDLENFEDLNISEDFDKLTKKILTEEEQKYVDSVAHNYGVEGKDITWEDIKNGILDEDSIQIRAEEISKESGMIYIAAEHQAREEAKARVLEAAKDFVNSVYGEDVEFLEKYTNDEYSDQIFLNSENQSLKQKAEEYASIGEKAYVALLSLMENGLVFTEDQLKNLDWDKVYDQYSKPINDFLESDKTEKDIENFKKAVTDTKGNIAEEFIKFINTLEKQVEDTKIESFNQRRQFYQENISNLPTELKKRYRNLGKEEGVSASEAFANNENISTLDLASLETLLKLNVSEDSKIKLFDYIINDEDDEFQKLGQKYVNSVANGITDETNKLREQIKGKLLSLGLSEKDIEKYLDDLLPTYKELLEEKIDEDFSSYNTTRKGAADLTKLKSKERKQFLNDNEDASKYFEYNKDGEEYLNILGKITLLEQQRTRIEEDINKKISLSKVEIEDNEKAMQLILLDDKKSNEEKDAGIKYLQEQNRNLEESIDLYEKQLSYIKQTSNLQDYESMALQANLNKAKETSDNIATIADVWAKYQTASSDSYIDLMNQLNALDSSYQSLFATVDERGNQTLTLNQEIVDQMVAGEKDKYEAWRTGEIERLQGDIVIAQNRADILQHYLDSKGTAEEASAKEAVIQAVKEANGENQASAEGYKKGLINNANFYNEMSGQAKQYFDQVTNWAQVVYENIANPKDINLNPIKTIDAGNFSATGSVKFEDINIDEKDVEEFDRQVQEALDNLNWQIALDTASIAKLADLSPEFKKSYDKAIADAVKGGSKEAEKAAKSLQKALDELLDALEDIDDLLIDINRDLNDIDVDYNPFTDLFEAWEAEWDYYYNIKNLLNQLEAQSKYIDNVISSDYSTATDKLNAYDAKVGNITAKLAANDAYILTLRAGIAQKAKEFEEQFNEYYNVDHRMGGWQIFQRDTTLNQWEENINDVKRYSFELSKLINQQENELNVLEANQDALEQERSAYESMLSTVDSLIDSLKDDEDITVDLSGLEGAKVKLEAAIDDGSIEEVKEQIRNLNDYIQELNWQLDLNDNVVEKGLEDAYDDMEDGIDHIQELIDTLNDKLAEQQELLQNLTDIYNYYIDTAIDMQQELYNAIVEQYQDEINKKKEQYDYLKQLDKDYLQSVKDNINKERQAREDANKQKNYQQNLQRAQLLQMDTSGAYRNELASLNKELESQRQDLYDDLVDKQVEALEKEIEKRHELYDMEVNALQERLDYMQENAILLWEMVNDIVSNGADEMMATLENTTNYINQNELAREKQRKQWELNTQATYKGVVEGEIESLNQRIAKGKEYIDSLAEIREAIELSTNTYIASKDILEDEAGKMQMVMDNYMQVWTTMTSDLTGYHENWKTTVAAIQNAMENNIQALEDLGNEGGSIYLLNEKLKNIANEMYNSFIEERQAFKNAVDNTIESVRANITAMANGVINAVQQTANSLQVNPNKDNGTSSAGNQYAPSSAANPAGPSGVQSVEPEKAKKYKIEINGNITDPNSGETWPIKSTLMGYKTQNEALNAANDYITRQIINFSNWLRSKGITPGTFKLHKGNLTPIAYKQGGFADFTGPAWLDGTKSKPEAVLNAKQTRLFTSMVSSLERTAANNSNINSALGSSYNIGDINTSINVEKLDNETDIDKVAKQVENRIMKSIHNRVVLSVV